MKFSVQSCMVTAFLILSAGLSNRAISQPLEGSALTLEVGLGRHAEIHELVSQLEYDGSALPLRVAYLHRNRRRTHRISLRYYAAKLENLTSNTRDIVFIELGYRVSLPVTSFTILDQAIRVESGLGWLTRAVPNEQTIATPFSSTRPENNGYYFSSLSGHLVLLTPSEGRHHFRYSLESPLVLYSANRTYYGVGLQHQLRALFDFLILVHELGYQYSLSGNVALTGTVRYDLNRFNRPTYYGSANRSLSLGLQWRF